MERNTGTMLMKADEKDCRGMGPGAGTELVERGGGERNNLPWVRVRRIVIRGVSVSQVERQQSVTAESRAPITTTQCNNNNPIY